VLHRADGDHRLRFRDFDKERLVTTASRLAVVGLVFLGSALSASAFFVTGFVFDDRAAAFVLAVRRTHRRALVRPAARKKSPELSFATRGR
jgi:hypothetical protein